MPCVPRTRKPAMRTIYGQDRAFSWILDHREAATIAGGGFRPVFPPVPHACWSADAPFCPPGPVPVAGRARPGAGAGHRRAGADPGGGGHRVRPRSGNGRLPVLLPAAHAGPDPAPVHASVAKRAGRARQCLPAHPRPAPPRVGHALGQSRHAAQQRLARPERRPGGAVGAGQPGTPVHADPAGPVERGLRHDRHAQHRHRPRQYRDRAAGLDRHPALGHAAHRRPQRRTSGPAP
ncbi:Uncharacterised protein [Achromobacter xylosoxidans]|nr:Uncharacterised protein [Achromobacter xylosoxidans]